MSDNKFAFNFQIANALIEKVEKFATNLDVQNGQMETRFGRLHDFFKDEGYDEFTTDMSSAEKSIKDVITQLHAVSKALAEYAQRIEENL